MEQFETEVKFYLTDIADVRSSILKLGAVCKGRSFETNIRFEDKDNNLIQKNSLLRLRKDTRTTLTFKSKPADKNKNFKIFRELEVEVSDFHTMSHILEALGLHQEQIYEKWRETFVLNDTIFCLDTMPYGDFLEIEGKEEDIINSAHNIGLQWKKRILFSYLHIFDIIKKKMNLPFFDVTFNNFKDTGIDLSQYLHILEAG